MEEGQKERCAAVTPKTSSGLRMCSGGDLHEDPRGEGQRGHDVHTSLPRARFPTTPRDGVENEASCCPPPPPPPSTGTLRPRRIPCLSRLEFLGSSPESANAGKRKLLLTSTAMRRSDKLPCTNLGKAGVVNEGQLSEHSVCPITDTFSRSFRSVFSESVELLETVSLPRENGERVGLRATMSRRYRPGFKCNQLLLYETSRKIA